MTYRKEHIKGYEEYQIDTNGVVYRKNGKPMKPAPNCKGYDIVNFYTNHKRTGFGVHTLVAKQFLENDNPIIKTQINHIDGDKHNNNVNNLEWVTPQENMIHSVNVLRNNVSTNNGNARGVIGYDKDTNEVIYDFDCMMDCAKYISQNNLKNPRYIQNQIYRVLKGDRKTYKHCYWKYKN